MEVGKPPEGRDPRQYRSAEVKCGGRGVHSVGAAERYIREEEEEEEEGEGGRKLSE